MNNIKVFENDLPDHLDLSKEKFIGLDQFPCLMNLLTLSIQNRFFFLIKSGI